MMKRNFVCFKDGCLSEKEDSVAKGKFSVDTTRRFYTLLCFKHLPLQDSRMMAHDLCSSPVTQQCWRRFSTDHLVCGRTRISRGCLNSKILGEGEHLHDQATKNCQRHE